MADDEVLAELKKIRELLTPAPPAAAPKGFSAEFKAFLSQYKVMGLAVAFILGLYLGMLVQALVKDLIIPFIGIPLGPAGNLTSYTIIFSGQTFALGDFLNAAITFVIVALVIFMIVKVVKRYNIS